MMFFCSFRMIKWTFIIVVSILLIHYWICNKSYFMSEEDIAAIGRKYAGQDPQKAFDQIHQELSKKYPGYILPKEDLQWCFMNCGSHMAAGNFLFGSLTEYLLFYGTAIDTNGHSGRFWANVSFTILTGEFHEWKDGTITTQVYKPGSTIKLPMGAASGVAWKAGTWTLEYGRGNIPSTLPFTFGDLLFSSQDFVSIYYILKQSTKAMLLYYTTSIAEMLA